MSGVPIFLMLAGLLGLMVLGIPLAFSVFAISIIVLSLYTQLPIWQLMQRFFVGVDSFVLTAIPFFMLAGNLMNSGKITDKLIKLSSVMVGHIRGGLAHINVVVSLLFGGISGSAVADTSGIGTILIPAMVKEGYSSSFSVAVTATSSVLGVIIPPSIIMIIYASTANVSIQAMFIAGIIPGILLGLSMCIVSYIYAVKYNYPKEARKTFMDFLKAVKECALIMIMPLIIIGGVLTGVFTATESAAIAVFYSLIITIFVDKTLKFGDLIPIFIETAKGSAVTLFCIGAASAFGYLLAYFRASSYVLGLMQSMNLSQTGFVVFVIILFIILGMFMDSTPAIVIFVPIIAPIGVQMGINSIHMGMIICLVLSFGLVTPPYGLCLLLGCQIGRIPPQNVFKDLSAFLVGVLITLLIVIFGPGLILWLPRLVVPMSVGG
jgi:tripartite ATP-independent transporter DctM subunit